MGDKLVCGAVRSPLLDVVDGVVAHLASAPVASPRARSLRGAAHANLSRGVALWREVEATTLPRASERIRSVLRLTRSMPGTTDAFVPIDEQVDDWARRVGAASDLVEGEGHVEIASDLNMVSLWVHGGVAAWQALRRLQTGDPATSTSTSLGAAESESET